MVKVMIDLYAGLGGASQAFVDDDEWEVYQIDNNATLLDYNPDLIMMDCTDLYNMFRFVANKIAFRSEVTQVFIWASPPCLEFSTGYSAPAEVAKREGREFQPSLTCMLTAKQIIDYAREISHCRINWAIENVRGAINHFTPHLGKYQVNAGAYFVWGDFPKFEPTQEMKNHRKPDKRHSPIRSNIRAKIPKVFSETIKKQIENQYTLYAIPKHGRK